MSVRFFYLPQRRFALTWSPKCACTTVSGLIAQYVSKPGEFGKETKRLRPYLQKKGVNIKGHKKMENLFDEQKLDRFAVMTRDPLSRLVSAFTNKFLIRFNKKNKLLEIARRGKYEAFSLKFIKDCAESGISLHGKIPLVMDSGVNDFSLAYFLHYINHEDVNIISIDDHFSPQIKTKSTLQLYSRIRDSVNEFKIIRVESLNSDLQELEKMLDFKFTQIHRNKSPLPEGWQKSDDPAIVELSTKELTENKQMPTRKALHSYLQLNGIEMSIFKYDSEFFNYQV